MGVNVLIIAISRIRKGVVCIGESVGFTSVQISGEAKGVARENRSICEIGHAKALFIYK